MATADTRSAFLLPQHQSMIDASAIAPDVARVRGYRSIERDRDLRALGFADYQCRVPGLLVPLWSTAGVEAGYQFRPDDARVDDRGKRIKYESPPGQKNVIDVNPTARHLLAVPSIDLWFTEGARKADASISAGRPCVSLAGVFGWRGSNWFGGKQTLLDFDDIVLGKRRCLIAYDSDLTEKKGVKEATIRLGAAIERRGGEVFVVAIPPGTKGEKVGLDDYLAASGDLAALAEAAIPLGRFSEESTGRRTNTRAELEDRPSASTVIVGLVAQTAELWHDPTGTPLATMAINGHHEHHRLRSSTFKSFASRLYYQSTSDAASGQALSDAITTITAQALFDGPEYPSPIRVAVHENGVYWDLADDDWRAVEITAEGWTINERPPVRFRRGSGALALPVPQPGGSVELFARHFDVSGFELMRLIGWCVAALCPDIPYPILNLKGPQGSGNTTKARWARSLVDPCVAPVRSVPKDEGDLIVAAAAGHVTAFDNLSEIKPWLADALCRLATGGGLGKRQLYTDDDTVIVDVRRPVIVTAIGEPTTRADYLDRTLGVELPRIDDHDRRAERDLDAVFQADLPLMLGVLCDAVSCALRNWSTLADLRLPRMADAARWVEAAAPVLGWQRGAFSAALAVGRTEASLTALEGSPVGQAILRILDDTASSRGTEWKGTAQQLLQDARRRMPDDTRALPQSARGIAEEIKRLEPSLFELGILLERTREGHNRERMLRVFRREAAA
jgi:hypothetical protein